MRLLATVYPFLFIQGNNIFFLTDLFMVHVS
jgi:hypothetical protein